MHLALVVRQLNSAVAVFAGKTKWILRKLQKTTLMKLMQKNIYVQISQMQIKTTRFRNAYQIHTKL